MSNPIVSAIVTGIIVFFITWPINNVLTKKASNKDLKERVERANRRIIEMCTNYLIMEGKVSDKVFGQIIKGVCVESNIDDKMVYSVKDTKAVLINTFIDMRFIQDNVKLDIINNLSVDEVSHDYSDRDLNALKELYENKKNTKGVAAFISSMIAMVVTLVATLFSIYNITSDTIVSPIDSVDAVLPIILLVIVLEMILTLLLLKINKRTKREVISMEEIDRICCDDSK